MTDDAALVRRVDDRLGLPVLRTPLSARSLVTYARDHVSVRTPSRPDLPEGNSLDLETPPAPAELGRWVERFHDTVGRVGAAQVRLRWEQAPPADAPPSPPVPDPALGREAQRLGLRLTPLTVLLLDRLEPAPGAPPADLRPVEAPPAAAGQVGRSASPGGPAVARRWHAATVLYRYARGHDPEAWRSFDPDLVTWRVEVQREQVAAGRALVWLAMRHGAPVARLTLAHDRQGLAVVDDLVVHPAHRRRGLGSALVHRAVEDHLDVRRGDRVGVAVEPGSAGDRLHRRLGFRPHATVWTALGDG